MEQAINHIKKHTYIHTYVHTYTRTYTHSYIHKYTYTYTYTNIHILHTYIHNVEYTDSLNIATRCRILGKGFAESEVIFNTNKQALYL